MSSNIGVFHQENDLYSNLHVDWGVDDYVPNEIMVSDGGYYHHPGVSSGKMPTMLVLLVVVMGIVLISVWGRLKYTPSTRDASVETAVSQPSNLSNTSEKSISAESLIFAAPYTDYTITQGIHGMSYGHMAIDIAAGRGEPILAPISGIITQLYVDEYGNPTLVIENDVYQVMFLHGDYSVAVGDTLKVGQVIGAESNKGYTMDMAGNLCYNREWCGNHTHLNVFDKRIQSNINPLDLIGG